VEVAFSYRAAICCRHVLGSYRITPVPGGVGPTTIAMLMKNTLQAARQLG